MGTGDLRQEEKETRYHNKMAREIAKKGAVLLDLDDQLENPHEQGVRYVELRLKLEAGDGDEVLGILKRDYQDGKQIAFHYGSSAGIVVEGLVSRLRNGSLKWREDKPYEER